MRTEVPAKPRKAVSFVMASTAAGAAASAPRKALPRMDMRSRVPVMYSAVLRPGRTPAMDAPCGSRCGKSHHDVNLSAAENVPPAETIGRLPIPSEMRQNGCPWCAYTCCVPLVQCAWHARTQSLKSGAPAA